MSSISIRDLQEDGVDHINVREYYAKTELGKALSTLTPHAFTHPQLGPFASVENFWHFVRTRGADDALRTVSPKASRSLAREHPTLNIPGFHLVIRDAFYHRLLADPELLEKFKDNKLPYVVYKEHLVDEGPLKVRIEETRQRFIVKALNELDTFLKYDEVPQPPNYQEILPDLFTRA